MCNIVQVKLKITPSRKNQLIALIGSVFLNYRT